VLSHLHQRTNYRRQSLLATKSDQCLLATESDASVCQSLFATESDGSVCVCLENKADEATGTSHSVQPVCAELLGLAFLHHLILCHYHSCRTLFHSSQILYYSCRTLHLDGERHLPETDVAFFAPTASPWMHKTLVSSSHFHNTDHSSDDASSILYKVRATRESRMTT
jgi:hypothetical protein